MFRELVRELLDDEGYLTMAIGDTRYVPRTEHHQGAVDRRADVLVKVALVSLIASPVLQAIISHIWK